MEYSSGTVQKSWVKVYHDIRVQEKFQLTWSSVEHLDVGITHHGSNHGIQRLVSWDTGQEIAVEALRGSKAHFSILGIQVHVESVGHKAVRKLHGSHHLAIVDSTTTREVEAPAVFVVSHQSLVAVGAHWSIGSCHANAGKTPTLRSAPHDLKDVTSAREAMRPTSAIRLVGLLWEGEGHKLRIRHTCFIFNSDLNLHIWMKSFDS